ncbi:MAG: phosphate ABC transporter substrate-binding protein [Candidatus Acidiferrum sp.]
MKRGSALWTVILLSASGSWGQTKATVIRIQGSPSLDGCTQHLTEWYHNNHADTSFTVGGGGPGKGIIALVEGRAEIAQSTRQVLGGETGALRDKRGKKFIQIPVATEVAGILVHPSNPVKELSIFDLRQILSGTVKNWKQVGGNDAPIEIYGRDDSSDSREFIEGEFMGDEGIASSAATFPKNSALYAAVARDKNGIGYGSVNLGLNPNVRFVAIKASSSGAAVSPTTENIREHRYPLMRPLYYIFAGEPSGELQRFGEWVLSAQGQLVVEAAEFWPLGSTDREQGKTLLAAR